jgi:hypothetical protein
VIKDILNDLEDDIIGDAYSPLMLSEIVDLGIVIVSAVSASIPRRAFVAMTQPMHVK